MPIKDDSSPEKSTQVSSSKKKSMSEAVLELLDSSLLHLPKKSREEKLVKLTDEQKQQLLEIEENAIANFSGQLDELESALGMLRMGHQFGWKVLYLIHSKRTIRKYEGVLDIKVREVFPETGPSSYRSYGLGLAEKYSNFWKVAGGDIKIPDQKEGRFIKGDLTFPFSSPTMQRRFHVSFIWLRIPYNLSTLLLTDKPPAPTRA